jgi:hypothetical protein
MFGSVNALFSGFAFAGIIVTILLQSEELALQRKELGLTREELKLTRKEFKRQSITLKRQRFESTFFNMLSIHNEQLSSLQATAPNGTVIKHRHVLIHIVDQFSDYLSRKNRLEYTLDHYMEYRRMYSAHIQGYQTEISPYLQSLVALYEAIERYTSKPNVRERYFGILKSYITLSERKFLVYHVILSEDGFLTPTLNKLFEVLSEPDFGGIRDKDWLNKSHINLRASYQAS